MRAQILLDHNTYQAKHKSPPLKFNETLNKAAQSHAEKLARNNIFEHSHSGYGENLYYGYNLPATNATKLWYNEGEGYDYAKGVFTWKTGHFSQLVWKASTHIGVGIATSNNGTQYVVANYFPAGNVEGHFIANVLKP